VPGQDKVGHRSQELLVIVESDRLPDNHALQFKLTPEGLVIDHIDQEGEVVATFCQMYDELIHTVLR
jgi:hypothetical protein